MITRRQFGVGSMCAAVVGAMGSVGCTLSLAGVQALLAVLIASIQSILKVATGATWAASLSSALGGLQTAEQSWKAGGAITILEDALNSIEVVLAVIPLTAVFSPLIDIIVSGIEAVIAVIPVNPSVIKLRASLSTNPHHNRIPLRKPSLWHETPSGAFKAQYNSMAKEIGLPQAQI